MHEQQRKFFASNSCFRIASGRRYGRSYAQKDREATLKAIEATKVKSNFKIIAVDECKEFTLEDSGKITELLRGRMDLQSFISTENSDWLREYAKEQSHDRQ